MPWSTAGVSLAQISAQPFPAHLATADVERNYNMIIDSGKHFADVKIYALTPVDLPEHPRWVKFLSEVRSNRGWPLPLEIYASLSDSEGPGSFVDIHRRIPDSRVRRI